MAGESLFAKWLQECLPEGVGARLIDGDAIDAWMERNPDATDEEIAQIMQAPDNVLRDVVGDGGEEA
jgi:hypothetical protein